MASRGRRGVTLLSLALLLSACGGGGADDKSAERADHPYSADLREAKKQATSSLEREILEDLEIERFEYEEAVDAYVACMNDRGIATAAIDQAGYFVYETRGTGDDSVDADCREGTIDPIEGLYVDQLMNPERLDINVVIRGCFIRHEVVDGAYSLEDLERDMASGFESAPFDPTDKDVEACMANPST